MLILAKCFHDAVIDEYHTEDDKLVLTLTGVWGLKSLTLTFEGNITSHFIDTKVYAGYFDSASLFIADDGQVCLVSWEGFDNKVWIEAYLSPRPTTNNKVSTFPSELTQMGVPY